VSQKRLAAVAPSQNPLRLIGFSGYPDSSGSHAGRWCAVATPRASSDQTPASPAANGRLIQAVSTKHKSYKCQREQSGAAVKDDIHESEVTGG